MVDETAEEEMTGLMGTESELRGQKDPEEAIVAAAEKEVAVATVTEYWAAE